MNNFKTEPMVKHSNQVHTTTDYFLFKQIEIVGHIRFRMTANGWCYEQVCLAEMFKLPKMLLANLLIARVIGSRDF